MLPTIHASHPVANPISDATAASCYCQEDTDRLLGTIEGGFGGLPRFSNHVRTILAEGGLGLTGEQSKKED